MQKNFLAGSRRKPNGSQTQKFFLDNGRVNRREKRREKRVRVGLSKGVATHDVGYVEGSSDYESVGMSDWV